MKSKITFKCEICRKEKTTWFCEYERAKHHYCSQKCHHTKHKVFECQFCGSEKNCSPSAYKKAKSHYCSVRCFRLSSRIGHIDKNGYKTIVIDTDDGSKYVLEHRYVMENMLGRKLHKNETVHHKNGIRSDNGKNNLELWTGRHGRGARVRDLRAYLKTIPKYLGGLK